MFVTFFTGDLDESGNKVDDYDEEAHAYPQRMINGE
jgi:hypothetical protein